MPECFNDISRVYTDYEKINIAGIYTHLYGCGKKGKRFKNQIGEFNQIIRRLQSEGKETGIIHAANSVTLFNAPEALFDAVRVGSALTGRLVTKEKYGLKKVGHYESAINEIKLLPKGHNVGNGGLCKTREPTIIGIVPFSYSQGFCVDKSREIGCAYGLIRCILSDIKKYFSGPYLRVLINGQRAPVLGQVGMNHVVINLNNINCKIGDKVEPGANPIICGDKAAESD